MMLDEADFEAVVVVNSGYKMPLASIVTTTCIYNLFAGLCRWKT